MKTMPALLAVLCALLFTVSSKAATTVNFGTLTQIAGPADLDLAGEMTHAINFSANDGPMYVKGVKFVPDTALAPGLTVGPNNVTPWQTIPNFGTGTDEDNLETLYHDIRWADNTAVQKFVEAHLPVTAGETYKLQILFYGNQTEDRRWDIEVEGAVGINEVSSLGASTGPSPGNLPPYSATAGLVYTHTLTAGDGTLDIRMGTLSLPNDGGDRNPIWQALTVEHIVPDLEPDGLPDAWETATFGSTGAQTGAGDADSDGLSNQYEYQIGSNSLVLDTDGDTLNDGAEYFTHRTNVLLADGDGDGLNDAGEVAAGTNPNAADTDGDGLSDGQEVNTYATNPRDIDSDNDDYFDGYEVAQGFNPASATSFPVYSTQVRAFSGADHAEGLDFTGNFIAAARFGISGLNGFWPVKNATFAPYHQVPGLTQNGANQIDDWITMTFPGPLTAADTNLATVMHSIRYQATTFNINYSGLTAGRTYKVQLLFAEFCCNNRGFDVWINNSLVADEFSPPAVHGGANYNLTRGAAIIHGFVATGTSVAIRLDKIGVTSPGLGDPNPILNAMTIEEVPIGADLDGDGLPDTWEMDNFGNTTSQIGTGDPDNDGLPNSEELTNNTKPLLPDTDNDGLLDGVEVHTLLTNPREADTDVDGLADGVEVNTTHTSPTNADTDRDTLADGAEVNTHGSNPLTFDSDSDGYNDPTEVLNGTNPVTSASKPGDTHLARVLGPDAGEGLDLFGNFLYAFNVGSPGAAGQIHDANFTADNAPGITLTAPNNIPNWFAPDFGNSTDENNLEFIYQSIRWADAALPAPNNHITLELSGLTTGRQYKLQLMFMESCGIL